MTTRLLPFAVAVLLLATWGQGSRASTPGNGGAPQPFPGSLAGIRSARCTNYSGHPGVAVRDEASFDQMRTYLLERYATMRVTNSYTQGDAVFDCQLSTARRTAATCYHDRMPAGQRPDLPYHPGRPAPIRHAGRLPRQGPRRRPVATGANTDDALIEMSSAPDLVRITVGNSE